MSGSNSYVLRRLLIGVPVLIGVVTLVFGILHLTPGDPVRQMLPPDATEEDVLRMREHLGLNDPIHVQYTRYWGRVLQGDFGQSLRSQRPVLDEITCNRPSSDPK